MKYLQLLFANLRRKKIRTTLTIGSFAVALFLFGILVVVHFAFYQGVEVAGADRLVVINRTSIIQPLPMAYKEKLAQMAGITGVTYANWFGGVYQEEKNFFRSSRSTATPTGKCSRSSRSRRPMACVRGRPRGGGRRRSDCQALRVQSGRPHPDQGTIFPGTWSSTSAQSTRGSGRTTTRRNSGSTTSTSTSAAHSGSRGSSAGTRCG